MNNFLLFDNTDIHKLKCNCNNTFSMCKTNRNFKIGYKERISKIKLRKAFSNTNFANVFYKIIIVSILV